MNQMLRRLEKDKEKTLWQNNILQVYKLQAILECPSLFTSSSV